LGFGQKADNFVLSRNAVKTSKEVEIISILPESSKEAHGIKNVILPVMMMMISN
jgi:hypothetical protein